MKKDYNLLIGAPFKDMGRGPNNFDCWGVVIYVRRMYGLYTPDYGVSANKADAICFEYNLRKADWIEINKKEKPMVGDVILFNRTDGGLHFGVVVEDGYFAQANKIFGFHLCKVANPILFNQIQSFYRFEDNE
jgi:cell wall-associated NlpC family hydrolase